MKIRIEDCFEDILSKAQAGLGFSDHQLAENAAISIEDLATLKSGKFIERSAISAASALKVNPAALVALAKSSWYPEVDLPEGLHCFNTPFPVPGYEEMTVNAYLIVDPRLLQAVAFDTGGDANPIVETIEREAFNLELILITHSHSDHVKDLLSLKSKTEAKALAPKKEKVAGAESFEPGQAFKIGCLDIRSVETSGHSPGGVTYIVEGLAKPVAIVGDALFCGSAGGAAKAWDSALKMVKEEILSLPPETIICPGHGPVTTVAFELEHNPLFA